MRTGPVALGYLADAAEPALIDAAHRIAQLTHWEEDNLDATALWSLAIRHAIRTGEIDVAGQVRWLPPQRQQRWIALIDEATAPGIHPRDFSQDNGWVVRAFQAALAAVAGASDVIDAVERAIRGGNDTDTVAAIAGALVGARFGAASIPGAYLEQVHGYPGVTGRDLLALASRATNRD